MQARALVRSFRVEISLSRPDLGYWKQFAQILVFAAGDHEHIHGSDEAPPTFRSTSSLSVPGACL